MEKDQVQAASLHEVAADLARIDLVAQRFLAAVVPIELRVAAGSTDLLASFRLRYQAVIEQGWMRPVDFPDRLEREYFDEDAIHILAWDGTLAVGTARVVLPRQGRKLPTEEAFELAIEPPGKVVDCGRVTVLRTYPGMQHQLFLALLGRSWVETRARGYSEVCGSVTAAAIRLYRLAANFTITPIGPPRRLWGEKRYPARFEFRVRS